MRHVPCWASRQNAPGMRQTVVIPAQFVEWKGHVPDTSTRFVFVGHITRTKRPDRFVEADPGTRGRRARRRGRRRR